MTAIPNCRILNIIQDY